MADCRVEMVQRILGDLAEQFGLGRRGGRGRGVWCLVAFGLLVGLPADAAERRKARPPGELVNVFVSPGNAQWLVGPIALMASDEEVDAYLEITDDEAAERFIDSFWSRRKPIGDTPGLTARQQFEHLAEEADRLYGEETLRGRHTDRGTIFILYGPPDEVDHKPVQRRRVGRYRSPPVSSGQGMVERWIYNDDKVGLDGRAPKRTYRFIRRNDLTRFANGSEP